LHRIRQTTDDRVAAGIRLALAVLFMMTGIMKLVVPSLAEAFSGQLLAAQLPFYTLTLMTVPLAEIVVSVFLGAGAFVRPASLVVGGMMAVATYVHVVVDDPTLFPLQPSEPIIPLLVIVMSAYLLWRGGGAKSLHLKATSTSS